MIPVAIFLVVAGGAVCLFYAVSLYNGLVRLKNNASKAWANIDVLLKQRHDELPKLIETCKQYMKYESGTLEKIMQARAAVYSARESGNVQALGAAEGQLRGLTGSLFAVAENYPDLKSNQTFQNLQSRISSLESALSDRRELYNESANLNNARREMFPDSIVASYGNFPAFQLLSFDPAETKDVDVRAAFNS
ncbi:MAG: LemA family protein [Elusimicrobia bacterium]|nr:LemA family protein [Elusimicrobiota bacterium]